MRCGGWGLVAIVALLACGSRTSPGDLRAADGAAPAPDAGTWPDAGPVILCAEQLALGNHTCVRKGDGAVECVGRNDTGQLGGGSIGGVDDPKVVRVALRAPARELAAGILATCALLEDDSLWCWGDERWTKGGLGSPQPVPFERAPKAVGVTVGDLHSCMWAIDGTAWCWGVNASGQLGDGTMADRLALGAVVGLPEPIGALAAGGSHTCALTTGGNVLCWGANDRGQLGDGTNMARSSPAPVAISDVVELRAGRFHTCARRRDGTAWCWGANGKGQLGDGTSMDRSSPAAVVALGAVASLAAGDQHSCASAPDGTVSCWGSGLWGELGLGNAVDRWQPAPVSGISGVREVAAGGSHTCARKNDGSVLCWGQNFDGAVGDGTKIDRTSPVRAKTFCL